MDCGLPSCTVNGFDLELYASESRLFENLFCQNQNPGLRVSIPLIYGKYFNKLSLIVEGKYRNILLACVDLICKPQAIFKPFTCAHLLCYCGSFNQNYSSLGVLLPSWGCSFSTPFLEYWFRISEACITSYLEKLTRFIPFQKYSNSKYRQKTLLKMGAIK